MDVTEQLSGSTLVGRISRAVAVVSLVVAVLFFIPFQPAFPNTPGLDMSWSYAMNMAVAQHLVFGKDVIFTFGPWASVYTGVYHAATDSIMLLGSAIIGIGLCAGFSLLVFDRRPALLIFLPLAVSQAVLRDTVFFAIPLCVLLSTVRFAVATDNRHFLRPTLGRAALFFVAVCAAGVIPLVKGSFAGLSFGLLGCSFLMLVLARRTALAGGIVVVTILSLCIGWSASGQALHDLPHFFLAQGPIIAGYSEAMSIHGKSGDIGMYSLASMLAFVLLVRNTGRGWTGVLTALGFAFFVFVVFKAGFVRQDGHQRMSAVALLFVALAVSTFLSTREALVLAFVSIAMWMGLERSMGEQSLKYVAHRPHWAYVLTRDGLERRIGDPDYLAHTFAEGNAQIRAVAPITGLTGSADVYPTNLSVLFANGIKWDGRPVLQSYSAYRPELDKLNADHLVGNAAPDNVLLAVGPIDGRLPTIEDASSWLALLDYYRPSGMESGYLKLIRSTHCAPVARRLADANSNVGQSINIPTADIVTARIDMHPTLLGSAALAVFKLPRVYLKLRLDDGKTVSYRYVPSMGETNFLLSPLVRSPADFEKMYSQSSDQHRIVGIKIDTPAVGLWNRSIHVTLTALDYSCLRQ